MSRAARLPLAAALLAGRAALAQPAARSPSCLDSILASAMRRTIVHLAQQHADPALRGLPLSQPGADLFLQTVAQRVREMLDTTPGVLPRGDARLDWRELGGHLLVVARRDGTFAWRTVDEPRAAETEGTRGLDLVDAALASLRAEGERYPWDGAIEADSVAFRVLLVTFRPELMPRLTGRQSSVPSLAPVTFPVMTLPEPAEMAPVQTIGSQDAHPHYPTRWRQAGVEMELHLQFVVDAAGHADVESLRDVDQREHPTRAQRDAQRIRDDFVLEVRRVLGRIRFEPATVGGCRVAQLVQQPFTFSLAGVDPRDVGPRDDAVPRPVPVPPRP